MKITVLIFIKILLTCIESVTVQEIREQKTIRTNSNKLPLYKCCANYAFVSGYGERRKCVNTTKTIDFSNITIFNYWLDETGQKFDDIFELIPGKFISDPYLRAHSMSTLLVARYYNTYLTENGVLVLEKINEYDRFNKYGHGKFCIDYDHSSQPSFWAEKVKYKRPLGNDPYITATMMVSSCCLIIVLVVYAMLPELRNRGGMILMAYVASLLCAFTLLAYTRCNKLSENVCYITTLIIYYCFVASFCWMNVMSIDIWCKFRSYVKAYPGRRCLFRFLMYCLYAWGVPLCLTLMMAWIDRTDLRDKPWFIKPDLKKTCFISGGEKLVYLYTPMVILICSNWLFFVMTAYNIWRLNRGTSILETSRNACAPVAYRSQKRRFIIYLKLSVVMGLNWLLEAVSHWFPDDIIFYITDMYNNLIGLFIFIIFVCKAKIIRKIYRKLSRNTDKISTLNSSSSTTSSQMAEMIKMCNNPNGPDYTQETNKS